MSTAANESAGAAGAFPNSSGFLDSEFRYRLFPAFYGIIFILGVFANAYVLFVIRRLRQAKSMGEIRIYMINLTVADLLFVSALPLWISYYSRGGNWIFKEFLCRVTGSFFFINTYCSILFLGAISINRYWAVKRPLDAASSDHRRRGVAVCAVIWTVTILMAVPSLTSTQTNVHANNVTRCFEGFQDTEDVDKRVVAAIHFAIIAMFFVVFCLVIACNLLIAHALLSQGPPRPVTPRAPQKCSRMKSMSARPTGVKRKALQMLMSVVGVFVLCFLPHHVVQGFWTLAVLEIRAGWGHVSWSQDTRQAFNDAHQVTLLLMGLNCILDPVVYFFATRKFRRFIKDHFRKVAKGDACSSTAVTNISMDTKQQSQRFPSDTQAPEGQQ